MADSTWVCTFIHFSLDPTLHSLHLTSVAKHYTGRSGSIQALGPISLSVTTGEWITIVGPSGCGKSTLLSIIAGLTEPSSGSITWAKNNGVLANSIPRIGMMFQDPRLLPWRTSQQNVALGIEDSVTRDECMGISAKLLNAVGLKGFEQSYPRQLSGGMRQRVALARTLAIRPQVLLLDEPLGAIDYVVRMQLQRDLEDLWSAENWTVLYVTHDPMEAVVLSDRILVLSSRPGIIVHQMTPDLPRPRQRSDPQVIRVWEMLVQALTDSSEGEDV